MGDRYGHPPYRYGDPGYQYGIRTNDMGDGSIDMVISHINMGHLITLEWAPPAPHDAPVVTWRPVAHYCGALCRAWEMMPATSYAAIQLRDIPVSVYEEAPGLRLGRHCHTSEETKVVVQLSDVRAVSSRPDRTIKLNKQGSYLSYVTWQAASGKPNRTAELTPSARGFHSSTCQLNLSRF